jgi:Cu2+-exporting ATPase
MSQHPLAKAVDGLFATDAQLAATSQALEAPRWSEVREQAGSGLEARDEDGRLWRLGSAAWVLEDIGLGHLAQTWPNGRVWWAPQSDAAASSMDVLGLSLDEQLRASTLPTVLALRAQGLGVAILSGDQPERVSAMVQHLAVQPPLDIAKAGATPKDKLDLVAAKQQSGEPIAVVGDGINDAPVLARAAVSFALDQGAPLAQSQADFIVLGGHLEGIALAVSVSRRAMRIVHQNLVWAAGYNFVCIPIALAGYLPPWLAGLGMATSSLAVMLNSLRLQRNR